VYKRQLPCSPMHALVVFYKKTTTIDSM